MTTRTAIFAGGCFWCTESEFQAQAGVHAVTSGYTGGTEVNPTYQQVSRKLTSHLEAVEVVYDSTLTTYEQLLNVFWGSIDPTDAGGQFFDRGPQYQTAIFVQNAEERAAAEASKAAVEYRLGRTIATTIRDAGIFYPAEEYHQDFYQKDPDHYNAYVKGSGRKEALKKIWK